MKVYSNLLHESLTLFSNFEITFVFHPGTYLMCTANNKSECMPCQRVDPRATVVSCDDHFQLCGVISTKQNHSLSIEQKVPDRYSRYISNLSPTATPVPPINKPPAHATSNSVYGPHPIQPPNRKWRRDRSDSHAIWLEATWRGLFESTAQLSVSLSAGAWRCI